VVRLFRRFGWSVHEARDGVEARQLAREHTPAVVVLDADAKYETGWLTCAKLVRDRTPGKVILVGRDLGPEAHRLTRFVGAAALVGQEEGAGGLFNEVFEAAPLPAVG
jgi:DNA-binding response OmpR family regulator